MHLGAYKSLAPLVFASTSASISWHWHHQGLVGAVGSKLCRALAVFIPFRDDVGCQFFVTTANALVSLAPCAASPVLQGREDVKQPISAAAFRVVR